MRGQTRHPIESQSPRAAPLRQGALQGAQSRRAFLQQVEAVSTGRDKIRQAHRQLPRLRSPRRYRHSAKVNRHYDLVFELLHYAPTLEWPKFLWAECAATDELRGLQKHLLAAFNQTDEKPFRPHVTLARIRKEGRMIAHEHPIDQRLAYTQQVQSIEFFRSPERDNGGYQVIASLPLSKVVGHC
ncbi:protein of unknown function (plasmid) [Methylocella tundrae]|uniref:RNA 2',3'-cyclic phosphodiesterase n=1 Tax=Methylocella tundrae TaxID=227605 RepID=A0A4U8Z754_METTU|nr:protein of unknown function [Methylocella tundrae]